MLLTLSTESTYAPNLGFILHKHPDRFQTFKLSFGQAHVFYPVNQANHCSACLALDVDAIQLTRRQKRGDHTVLAHYVNDRPFVASSFLSTAISQVFGSALAGRCQSHPELVDTQIPLTVEIAVLPVKGGASFVHRIFEPLGYAVQWESFPLDEQFEEWGDSPYFSVTLSKTGTVREVLNQLYVLFPVFDHQKHYYSSSDELQKLLSKGEGWLAEHPEKETIARRYLKFQSRLARQALAQLSEDDPSETEDSSPEVDPPERQQTLNQQRLEAVVAELQKSGANRVIDLGCGEGKLLRLLMKHDQFHNIVGVDVSVRTLEIASRRLHFDELPPFQAQRLTLLHGSLTYSDDRFHGFQAAAIVEVIEHLDPPRLQAFERVVFEVAKPDTVVLTTPNAEYNVLWESLPAGQFRHSDHRFEWTRAEFQSWAKGIAERFHYDVRFEAVGPVDENCGPPTQMAVFQRRSNDGGKR